VVLDLVIVCTKSKPHWQRNLGVGFAPGSDPTRNGGGPEPDPDFANAWLDPTPTRAPILESTWVIKSGTRVDPTFDTSRRNAIFTDSESRDAWASRPSPLGARCLVETRVFRDLTLRRKRSPHGLGDNVRLGGISPLLPGAQVLGSRLEYLHDRSEPDPTSSTCLVRPDPTPLIGDSRVLDLVPTKYSSISTRIAEAYLGVSAISISANNGRYSVHFSNVWTVVGDAATRFHR